MAAGTSILLLAFLILAAAWMIHQQRVCKIIIPNICPNNDIKTCPRVCKQEYNGHGYCDFVGTNLPFICICVSTQCTTAPEEKLSP